MPSVPRVLLLGLGVAVLAAAVFFALVDDTRGAVRAAVVAAGIVLLATRARSAAFPGRHWVALALILGGVAVIGATLIAAGVFVALVTLKVIASMGFARRLRRVELEPVAPQVVMERAEGVVTCFEAEGFRRSRVGWRRSRQTSCARTGGDDPSHVARAHQAALELLARRGVRPDRFGSNTEVLEAAREIDLRSIRFVAHAPLAMFLRLGARVRVSDHALGDDDRSRRRIDAWLAVEPAT